VPTLLAPAKINLTLEVLARRDDGYHALRSLMVPVALYDRISIEPPLALGPATSAPALASDNLVMRALAAAGFGTDHAVRLDKSIPIGGGLGGGSSDAAAVLRGAMEGMLGPVPDRDWIATARSLGSDVPFFLCGTGAIVEGTGERVTAVGALPAWWTVILRPAVEVETAQAYRLLDAAREQAPVPSRPRTSSATLRAVDALQRGDFKQVERALVNDFHAPVLAAYPPVARAHAAFVEAGASQTLLSGSGSCLFALFESEERARACAARLHPERDQQLFVCAFHRERTWR